MAKFNESEMVDFSNLAIDRCRATFMTVAQLVDDDAQVCGLLLTVGIDFVRCAVNVKVGATGCSEAEALGSIFTTMAEACGGKAVVVHRDEVRR